MIDLETWVAALRGSVAGSTSGVLIDAQVDGLTVPPHGDAARAAGLGSRRVRDPSGELAPGSKDHNRGTARSATPARGTGDRFA
jgi:hypothetical protein